MGDKILNALKKHLKEIDVTLVEPALDPDKGSLLLALKNNNIEINDSIVNNLK